MRYYDFLDANNKEIVEQLKTLMTKYKVEPVGNGYIDCIVMKDTMEEFIKEIGDLGILITYASWWCYVNPNPNESNNTGCPHGMGGPSSIYYEGWFSELQNDFYELDEKIIDKVLLSYDKQLIYFLNMKTLDGIRKMLEKPFRYTPKDYIAGNKCVNPGLWLLVPDKWKR
jgi:hypothetical protein